MMSSVSDRETCFNPADQTRSIRYGVERRAHNNHRRIQSSCISAFTFLFLLPSFSSFYLVFVSVVSVLLLVSLTFTSPFLKAFLSLCLHTRFPMLSSLCSLFHLQDFRFKRLKWEIKNRGVEGSLFILTMLYFSLPSPLYS